MRFVKFVTVVTVGTVVSVVTENVVTNRAVKPKISWEEWDH